MKLTKQHAVRIKPSTDQELEKLAKMIAKATGHEMSKHQLIRGAIYNLLNKAKIVTWQNFANEVEGDLTKANDAYYNWLQSFPFVTTATDHMVVSDKDDDFREQLEKLVTEFTEE